MAPLFKFRVEYTANELTLTKRLGCRYSRKASIKLRVARAEFINAPANDFSIPAARCRTSETPSAAFRQSSRESRSPLINSTFLPDGHCSSRSFKRSKRLEGRIKQPRLANPYSSKISTTFAPIKPLDPVTKMRSSGETMYSKVISRIVGALYIPAFLFCCRKAIVIRTRSELLGRRPVRLEFAPLIARYGHMHSPARICAATHIRRSWREQSPLDPKLPRRSRGPHNHHFRQASITQP